MFLSENNLTIRPPSRPVVGVNVRCDALWWSGWCVVISLWYSRCLGLFNQFEILEIAKSRNQEIKISLKVPNSTSIYYQRDEVSSWKPIDSERRRLNSKNRLRKRDYILFLCITLYSEEKQWSEKENYCRNTWRWCIMIHEPHNPSAWLASEWSDSIEVWFSNRWNWKTFNSINQNEAMTFKSRSLIRSRLQNILYCFFLDDPLISDTNPRQKWQEILKKIKRTEKCR